MEPITIKNIVKNRVETVWNAYNSEEDIKKWNQASEDWHCTSTTNDLRIGGKFRYRMEAKDGSAGFDFEGTYTALDPFARIAYTMNDGRKVEIRFKPKDDATKVTVTFDPESINPAESQREGWQAILNSFKAYVEHVYGTGTS
ncbi:hypothetical protein HP439_07475 [Sphingobacterium shayense]|uniref:SRPBCC domain-containing protein n=1 Tax=Sphingobacterium shayense TaxID=626343 RepID=UPI001553F052|nr:SRPBCC domain-containing protein [Sphingobacterium shayense]NQD70556.1 hypothetical protein [Sphingobacterium shayense]